MLLLGLDGLGYEFDLLLHFGIEIAVDVGNDVRQLVQERLVYAKKLPVP